MNLRDPVIYRVLHESASQHRGRSGAFTRCTTSPTASSEDAQEHITHSLCTLEFEDHRPLYDWCVENCLGIPRASRQIEFSRLERELHVMT